VTIACFLSCEGYENAQTRRRPSPGQGQVGCCRGFWAENYSDFRLNFWNNSVKISSNYFWSNSWGHETKFSPRVMFVLRNTLLAAPPTPLTITSLPNLSIRHRFSISQNSTFSFFRAFATPGGQDKQRSDHQRSQHHSTEAQDHVSFQRRNGDGGGAG